MDTHNTVLDSVGEQPVSDLVVAKACFLVSLVQGSQLLEGAAIDMPGCARLVERAIQLLREVESQKL
jgi:hypothetical protein